ncbi:hypothetical protein PybrP1_008583 [[Pythium] brassicae (nom. inval.)]|nr:hypothetical protein PybrP1_008583 [[Pythium] brassicae (nom. inval.)]
MAAAVLSLNGKPQVTLRRGAQGFVAEQQSASAAPVAVGAATQQVMQVLGALARIKISDGRLILGRLHCFDKHQNAILTEAREFPPLVGQPPEKGSGKGAKQNAQQSPAAPALSGADEDEAFEKHRSAVTSRSLGMTLVPGKHIVYIKVLT